MATVYKIELTSHWVNFSEEEIKEKILKALKDEGGNEVTISSVEKKA